MKTTTYTTNNTNCCDACGRSLDGKGWEEYLEMKLCGICVRRPQNPEFYGQEWEICD
jgi:hypothetical protein